ncbi:hypothetical protein AVEN_189764-1 [Araneus ventricosus]|uniref:Uncharacterized protein n=1 Tax=Araneus ventricosus TaxID=182803 RepID=A0A4Y2SUL4_ARAVE|nr:hypothetical protein AVEN_189764-1 [Araneus ventricosus]
MSPSSSQGVSAQARLLHSYFCSLIKQPKISSAVTVDDVRSRHITPPSVSRRETKLDSLTGCCAVSLMFLFHRFVRCTEKKNRRSHSGV